MDEYVGERIVIVDNQSPSYRLRSVSYEDLFKDGENVNPSTTYDVEFPVYVLPSTIRVACTESFGDGARFSVDRVSAGEERGFYIRESALSDAGVWNAIPSKLYAPLDTKYNRMRLSIYCKEEPLQGHLWWHVEFRYPT